MQFDTLITTLTNNFALKEYEKSQIFLNLNYVLCRSTGVETRPGWLISSIFWCGYKLSARRLVAHRGRHSTILQILCSESFTGAESGAGRQRSLLVSPTPHFTPTRRTAGGRLYQLTGCLLLYRKNPAPKCLKPLVSMVVLGWGGVAFGGVLVWHLVV